MAEKFPITTDYIYTHDHTYTFLVSYFLPDLSDPIFRREHAADIQKDERLAYCRHMAAWLPYEPHHEQIIQHIINNEEDAANASSHFLLLPKSVLA